MWCLCVSSFLRIYFFLHCTTYILLQYSNYSIQTTQPTPPHPYPTLIKYTGKGWTNKIILLPDPLRSLLPVICHTPMIHPWSIHDPWTIDFYQICWVNCKTRSYHPRWPKTPEQFIAVLFLLEMEDVFQEFLQNKSGCLDDPLFQEYHHTFFKSKWSSWVFI